MPNPNLRDEKLPTSIHIFEVEIGHRLQSEGNKEPLTLRKIR
jgi:hypothetical protein